MDELLNTAPCGFLTFGDDGRILAVNATLASMLGYEPVELEGRHVESVLSVGGRLFYQTHFFPLLKMHGKADEIYLSLRTKDGSEAPVLANAARRMRDGVSVNDCVFVPMRLRLRYEEELLQARRAAEQAGQAKAKFLSMMSHELRTPLTAIMGFADVLTRESHGPLTERQRTSLNRIKSASREMMRLIGDILEFARLETGKVDIRMETVSVDEALERAEALVSMRAQEAGLDYSRESCGDDMAVRADPDRLQQVLLNLLTNAIKFTKPGGRISLVCERDSAHTLIHVCDTGSGIPSDQQERIFEPFVQAERQGREGGQSGVGLGLAISRELTRAMGGTLTVESAVDQGSIFTVRLVSANADGPEV